MRRLLAVAAAVAALTGCAAVPDSGPVTKVGAVSGTNESTVRYAPAGPARDASPQDVVRGYLDAMLAYPMTSGTAARFLSRDAAKGWQPSAGVAIYDRSEVVNAPDADRAAGAGAAGDTAAFVRLTVGIAGTLDRRGSYAGANTRREFDFRLVKSGGQWRISNPQPGFLVSRKFFDDYYRPFATYFFDPTGKRLVAQPIYVPVGDQVSTGLLSSLLMGPGPTMRGIARSYLPADAELRTSIPLRSDGVAEVQFKNDFSAMSAGTRDRVAAQIAWTLRQVAQVNRIRVTGGDSSLLAGGSAAQPVDSWQEFGARAGGGTFFGVLDKRLVRVVGRAVDDVQGPWRAHADDVVELAVEGDHIAVVNAGRRSLLFGSLGAKEMSSVAGSGLLRPVWDDAGRLWVIDTPDGGTRLRLAGSKSVRTLKIGAIGNLDVRSFAISPDRARYALIAATARGTVVYVGEIVRDGRDEPVSLGPAAALPTAVGRLTNARSISWSTATSVSFLAEENIVGTQVFEARIDGSSIVGGTARGGPLLPDLHAVALATSGGDHPVSYVLDAAGDAWVLRAGEAWERLGAQKFTALTPYRE